MRRDVFLPEEDLAYLDSLGLEWETLRESNQEWLIVYGYSVPAGYNTSVVDIAITIPSGYPVSPLDMAYFNPGLTRIDGKAINATSHLQSLDCKSWQRWSRHRTAQNPWRPGIDNIITHFISINHWLEREFNR